MLSMVAEGECRTHHISFFNCIWNYNGNANTISVLGEMCGVISRSSKVQNTHTDTQKLCTLSLPQFPFNFKLSLISFLKASKFFTEIKETIFGHKFVIHFSVACFSDLWLHRLLLGSVAFLSLISF